MNNDSEISSIDDEPKIDSPVPKTKPSKAEKVQATSGTGVAAKTMATIMIHANEGEEGSKAVFVSSNGYARMLPRGQEIQVPIDVVEVLRNAKIATYKPGKQGKVDIYEIPRYSFSVLG